MSPFVGGKQLIIGAGEIGRALYKLLQPFYVTEVEDLAPQFHDSVDVLHICYGYSDVFVESVLNYKTFYAPKHVVIHSTVPPGTSDLCGAVHAPVIGKHYDFAKGFRKYTKFFGGKDADYVANLFLRIGVPVVILRNARTTEVAKLMTTTYLGTLVEFAKEFEKECEKQGVSFAEAYTLFLTKFNETTAKEGFGDPLFPVMTPIQKPLGGHCVLSNCSLWEWEFSRIVKELEAK